MGALGFSDDCCRTALWKIWFACRMVLSWTHTRSRHFGKRGQFDMKLPALLKLKTNLSELTLE